MNSKHRTGAYLYLLLTFFLWGSQYVVSKYVMAKLPPFTVAFGRYLIAFLALSVMARHYGTEKIAEEDRKYIFFIGFFGYFIAVNMQLFGTKLAGSSIASLLNSTNPVIISLMAAVLLGEKMTFPKAAGLFLSLLGVFLIIGMGSEISLPGILLSGGAVLGWSFMSVMSRKVTQKYAPLTVTRAAILITVLCDLPLCAWELLSGSGEAALDLGAAAGLLYMGLLCTALTLMLWNKSLSVLPASVCSAFYPVQTLTSSTLGILFLHEKAGLSFFAGSVLIIVGVLVSLLVQPRQKAA